MLSPGGYKHIAYFAHAADSRPVFLTEGNYEVVQVLSLDWNQKRMSVLLIAPRIESCKRADSCGPLCSWFVAANPSTTRRLFWIPFPDSKDNKVQEPEEWLPKAAYVQANFSPLGDYIRKPFAPILQETGSQGLSHRDPGFEPTSTLAGFAVHCRLR